MNQFKKKKLNCGITLTNCVICGITVETNSDCTCGSQECRLAMMHRYLQESQEYGVKVFA
jgi:hypothetical protein